MTVYQRVQLSDLYGGIDSVTLRSLQVTPGFCSSRALPVLSKVVTSIHGALQTVEHRYRDEHLCSNRGLHGRLAISARSTVWVKDLKSVKQRMFPVDNTVCSDTHKLTDPRGLENDVVKTKDYEQVAKHWQIGVFPLKRTFQWGHRERSESTRPRLRDQGFKQMMVEGPKDAQGFARPVTALLQSVKISQ